MWFTMKLLYFRMGFFNAAKLKVVLSKIIQWGILDLMFQRCKEVSGVIFCTHTCICLAFLMFFSLLASKLILCDHFSPNTWDTTGVQLAVLSYAEKSGYSSFCNLVSLIPVIHWECFMKEVPINHFTNEKHSRSLW